MIVGEPQRPGSLFRSPQRYALGSLGVIAAALIIMYTGWSLADPIIGAGIGLFIVPRT